MTTQHFIGPIGFKQVGCCSKLFGYYLSVGFVILENNSSSFSDVPLCLKQIINAEILHKNDLLMACYREMPSADNILKSITIFSGLYRDFA